LSPAQLGFGSGTYLGAGPRVTGVRGSPYRDTNLSISKKIIIKERLNIEVRAEAFNVFNNTTSPATARRSATVFPSITTRPARVP